MKIDQVIAKAQQLEASDVHLSVGLPMMFRIHGRLSDVSAQFPDCDAQELIFELLDQKQKEQFLNGADLDFAHELEGGARQRVNVFHQQKNAAATIRLLNNTIPTLEELKLPKVLQKLTDEARGLILITGPTGSGKSTTLAAMIDDINHSRPEHIITIEDPIEYVYQVDQCLIHQRETGRDVESFAGALRSALREDPDIILVGEMRDYETISAALTAAETGHLVLSTLHTTGAAQTIDRIVDACPSNAQEQIRTQLSGVLKGVITQCLIPDTQGKRVVATEVLTGSDAVLAMIRENKCHQLASTMQSSSAQGMHTLNMDLARLVSNGSITSENAQKYSNDKKDLNQFLRN